MPRTGGRVYLVGAGPGDPELLTLKGRRYLGEADAIVYDRLVSPALLELAPAGAERFYVGKGRDIASVAQEDVNDLLVDLARRGLTVVRLKGGDPFVFGRGGEEVAHLAAAGVAFEVVPGISSAAAVPAAAGIPVTDRRVASSYAVVTGHVHPDDVDSAVDWVKVAESVDTIVILMGMKNLDAIAKKIMSGGRAPGTPTAVVEAGTTTRQRTIVADLANIANKARRAGARAPAVIVVGEVVSLRNGVPDLLGALEPSVATTIAR